MSPFGLLGVSLAVVGGLVPGSALGAWLGRRGAGAPPAAVAVLAVEALLGWLLAEPVFGASAYVLCVGRAARRVDPAVRALGSRLGLDPLVDVEFPLVAPGVFAAASLAFAVQMALRLPLLPGLPIATFFALVALGIDLQHASALDEAGVLRGRSGVPLLPQLSVEEHLRSRGVDAPADLRPVLQRRPRHLTREERAALAVALQP